MNAKELKEILDKHVEWLETDGKEGERADLHGANLYVADLHGADLQVADLHGANLYGADLHGANLYGADLHGANLHVADLHVANLHGADLYDATLRGANLRNATLRGANLRNADLHDADLHGANLDYSAFPLWCGGLGVHIDDRQAIQLLYHLVSNVLYSKNTSQEMKDLCSQKAIVDKANEFHRVDECGRIVVA